MLERAEILYAMFEIDAAEMTDLIPAALNPTIPPVVTFVTIKAKDSPIGSFTLAQARIGCRAGVRPRGFPTGGYIEGDVAAAEALRDRWGFALQPAEVSLRRGFHDIVSEVTAGHRTILSYSALDPIPLTGAEVLFASSMQLARVRRNGDEQVRLVQVDPEFTFHKAARGAARLDAFDPMAWGEERATIVYPVSVWYAVCDLSLPKIRYLSDPGVPALQGTEKIG
ncbi:MAG: acetoacetate decarboxylase family protein [Candidatus Binatia bacterium]